MALRYIIWVALLLLLVRCKSGPTSEATITIATLKGPSSMGLIKMIDSLSKDKDQVFNIEILNEPIQVRKMVIDGTADFAILPTNMAAILYNRGLEYKLLAIPVWGTLYLFGNDTTINTWNELKGKRIHIMAKGMTPDILFRYLLQKNGIDPNKDLTLDYRFPTHIDLANAVAAGQADLAVISEPLVSLVMHRNKQVLPIFNLNEQWERFQEGPIAQTALIGKRSLIKTNPKLVEEVLSNYLKSTQWVNQNPDSAAVLIVKHGILPNISVAKNAIPRSNLNFVKADTIISTIENYLWVFYQINPDVIGGKLPDENFYN